MPLLYLLCIIWFVSVFLANLSFFKVFDNVVIEFLKMGEDTDHLFPCSFLISVILRLQIVEVFMVGFQGPETGISLVEVCHAESPKDIRHFI